MHEGHDRAPLIAEQLEELISMRDLLSSGDPVAFGMADLDRAVARHSETSLRWLAQHLIIVFCGV
jgi:hypothetical protein